MSKPSLADLSAAPRSEVVSPSVKLRRDIGQISWKDRAQRRNVCHRHLVAPSATEQRREVAIHVRRSKQQLVAVAVDFDTRALKSVEELSESVAPRSGLPAWPEQVEDFRTRHPFAGTNAEVQRQRKEDRGVRFDPRSSGGDHAGA